jgi:hypothetical protein
MGTSKSSSGPGSNVPIVPPWVPPPEGDIDSSQDGHDRQPQPALAPVLTMAPPGRFGPARSRLSAFARSGSTGDMQSALGHYVRKGYGGSASAARRMAGTARTAGGLYSAFSLAAAGQAAAKGSVFDPVLLAGRSADEVMDALVEAVRPTDGTQDAETGRKAIRSALSQLLDRFPEANLLDLTEDQRMLAIELFVAFDVYDRFVLDLGKTLQDNAESASAALSRLKEIKDYIRQTVSARFRALKKSGEKANGLRIPKMVSQALQEAFEVFEEYL